MTTVRAIHKKDMLVGSARAQQDGSVLVTAVLKEDWTRNRTGPRGGEDARGMQILSDFWKAERENQEGDVRGRQFSKKCGTSCGGLGSAETFRLQLLGIDK